MEALLAGLVLGLTVAVSFGPINALELDAGLRHGFRPAWGVGSGAALVDGGYAFLGGLGAAALVEGAAEGWLQLVGGAVLLVLAWRMLLRQGGAETKAAPGFGRMLGVALVATASNPFTIVYWTAAFGAIVPELGLSRLQATTLLPTGVLTGTLVWGTALAGGASWAGRYVEERLLGWITLASALTIAAFGAWFVAGGVRALA
jgi:L-lysine exporter family protein LysE/ArgO